MSDTDKPRRRARGRGRGQSPPPPGEHRPFPPQQAMPRQRLPLQPGGGAVRPGMQPMAPQQVRGMAQPRLMVAQQQRPMVAQQPMAPQQQYLGAPQQQRPVVPQQQQQQRPMMPQQQQRPMMPQQQQQRPMMPQQQQQQQRPMMPQQQQQRPMMPQQQQQQRPMMPQQQQQQRPMMPQQQQQQRPMMPQQQQQRPMMPQQQQQQRPMMPQQQQQQQRPMMPQQQQQQRPMMPQQQQQQRPMMPQQQQQRPMMPQQQQQQQQRPMMPQQQQQQQRQMAPQQQQQRQMAPQQQRQMAPQQQQQRQMAPRQQQPMAPQSALYPAGVQQPAGIMTTRPPALRPTADVRVPLPSQPRTRTPMQPGQQRPALPGQQAAPGQITPRMATSRQLAAQETIAATTVSRPDTSQSRAFYRGSDRMQAATQRATQASDDAALATQLGAMAVQEGSDGNGSGNGNGNGSSAVSVGRGMSRGGGRRLEGQLPVLRPHNNTKIGKGGRAPVKLYVNYFEMEKPEEWRLYQYDIQYQPEEDARSNRYKLMEPHFKHFCGHVFDGHAIFSAIRLTNKVTTYTSKREDTVYTVTVTMVKELNALDEQFIRFLNLILRRCQNHIKLKLIGRHYFNTDEAIPLGQELNMRVFPGYQTSIRQHEEKILVNVDIVHKFQHQTTMLAKMHKMGPAEIDRELIGQIVMARYNHLTYRVDSIRTDLTPKNKFLYRGGQVSYIDYYKEKYGIVITNVGQPLVHCKPTARQMRSGITDIFLVPELLNLTGIPEDMRRNYNQMKMLADYTKMGVDKRVAALKRFNQDLLSNEKVREDLAQWGLKLSSNLVTVESRVLEYENVQLERSMTNHPPDAADWTSQCRNQGMAFTVHLKNWVVLVPRRHEQDVGAFISVLQRAARSVGMILDQPEVVTVMNVGNCEAEIGSQAGRQMVMIILDRIMATKYGQLKKRLACQVGVLSQCVQGHNMTKKGVMSIATKIAIQMNAKLGGEPWRVVQPAKTAMVVGYDVYHDNLTPNKSFGAVVSSINPACTRYFGQVNAHHNKEELSDNFSMSIRNAVEQYHKANSSKYPATLIIYRDGVGEGQLDYVKEHEIPAIKRQLTEFGSEVKIALIFVVVCKRINTRMFAEVNGRLVNPAPGTVLDKVVTLPHQYDFFLVSQKVTQGTVTPTSYNVLEDTTKLSVDQVQRLTYKFTHLYYNWQGTVRVPAPCLYAHKLAYLTGTGTHELPKPKLTDKLWFI